MYLPGMSVSKSFDIFDHGKLSGRIYFDLEARKDKSGGAWMNDWETHYIDSKGKQHFASAFIVCNFSPASKETPSLLRHDDVVTLFHEMGHAVHHLFGTCTGTFGLRYQRCGMGCC